MDKEIVLYFGVWWPKKEQGLEITSSFAHPQSTAYQLTHIYNDAPHEISKYCNKLDVMIQAGGNAGFYVKKYSEIFKTVYTFEPIPLLFYCLNLNASKENVYKFNCCLGDKNECVSMNNTFETLGHGGSHVNLNSDINSKRTPTFSIDNLNLAVCDLIQLDLEGYELKALLGGIETIKRCKPVIVVEDFDQWAQRYDSNLSKIEELLFSLNYIFVEKVKSNGDCVYKYNY